MNNQNMINLINNYLSTIKEKDIPYTLDSWIFQAKQNVEVHKKILKRDLQGKKIVVKEG